MGSQTGMGAHSLTLVHFTVSGNGGNGGNGHSDLKKTSLDTPGIIA